MATVHVALAVINIFPFGDYYVNLINSLCFHNSQLTFPLLVVRNPTETASSALDLR